MPVLKKKKCNKISMKSKELKCDIVFFYDKCQ